MNQKWEWFDGWHGNHNNPTSVIYKNSVILASVERNEDGFLVSVRMSGALHRGFLMDYFPNTLDEAKQHCEQILDADPRND